MAASKVNFGSGFGKAAVDAGKAAPFLKEYTASKFQFNPKEFDPFNLNASGKVTLEGPPDLSRYGTWTPEDALRYQQAYGDMATQQAATAWRDIYQPGINQAKLYDLRLQKAGLDYRENSPTAKVQRDFAISGALANTAGADAALSTALANQLQSVPRLHYAGQTFTV
jgi:hypothetical protein